MSVTFFFGSGADTDYCNKLQSGNSFLSALLNDTFRNEITSLYGSEFKNYPLLTKNSSKFYVQTITSNETTARKNIQKPIIDAFLEYANGGSSCSVDYDKDILPQCKLWYELLMKQQETLSDEEKEVVDFFLKNGVLFDVLDEKFNSLRNTKLNSNAKRVISAYASVFILMIRSLYRNPNFITWKWPKVYEKLNSAYDCDELSTGEKSSCYYSLLKKSKLDCKVVTTNYTDLASKCTGQNDVIYLHGKLTWFEDLERLRVLDCTNSQEQKELLEIDSKKIVPFILIPSGVKPLICSKQINEFSKFLDAMSETNTLVIAGYKFNSEDNHINSIIAEWLMKEQSKIIYLNFKKDVEFSRIRWLDASKVHTVEFVENSFSLKEQHKKVYDFIVNDTNSRECFKKIVTELERIDR